MLSQHLERLVAFYKKGVFTQQEFSQRLVTLVTQENATELLDAVPAEAIPWLKEAVVTAAQDAVDTECLFPEESVFQENSVSAAYYLTVAQLLLEQFTARVRPGATVVCLPSFEVEWALRIGGSAKIGFTAILTTPEEKIWCHHDPRSIKIQTKQRAVETNLAGAIFDAWKKVLLKTRHPRRKRFGLDGVSYHFAYSGSGAGNLAGRTWSPARATVPGKLAATSHALRAWLEADDNAIERVRRELESCILEFKEHSEPEDPANCQHN